MEYIDLKRGFLPIKKDEEINFEVARAWGKRIGGWLDWNDLLKKERMILLAEASSGKTAEFQNRTQRLLSEGKAAFFLRIEELADEGFEQSLDPNAESVFQKWKNGFEDAYFFLDSVDEARLNRKRFDSALKKFAQKISYSLERSRIFISCRPQDWKGAEDERIVKQLLPVRHNTPQHSVSDPETALLAPIFSDQKTENEDQKENEPSSSDFALVSLAPLDEDQQRKLAQEVGVTDILFSRSIWKNGLDRLAERPGDLIELAEYWKSYGKFGSLSEMANHMVDQKLSEHDPYRPDNDVLPLQKAREATERIAAALTLGKTFTLRVSGQEFDPELTTGALEPRKLLRELNDSEQNALLRRGIFTLATYGRVRFHHRSTQEYLAAQWINRLLKNGCPRSKVFEILFAEVYGVKTLAPSLRPLTAWLSLSPDNDDVRDEILKRDPLILIQHGDPGSLPIETRRRLLHAYAEKHEAGDIANDSLDHRTLWMFTHPDLGETIREVWDKCTRYDFRGDLLRLIRSGAIDTCADLVSEVAQDPEANVYDRIVAVQALNECKSTAVLSLIADNLVQQAATMSARLVSGLSCELFPDYLNVDQLIVLIVNTQPSESGSTEGFGSALSQLWKKCPAAWRMQFIAEIAKLVLSKPFVDDYRRISDQYQFLAKRLEPIARELVDGFGDKEPPIGLLSLLMATERGERSYDPLQEGQPSLAKLVQSRPQMQRALFWADVEEVRENMSEEKFPIRHWQIFFEGPPLWRLNSNDLSWLYKDLDNRSLIDDKRICLSAIVSILQSEKVFEKERTVLREMITSFPLLVEDLENYLKPYEEEESEREHRLLLEQHEKERAESDEKAKVSWREFRHKLMGDPSLILSSDKCLWCIKHLAYWLEKRTNQETEKPLRQWRLIEEAFDHSVAESYRDVMKALWRDIRPERPRRKGNQTTTKWSTIYAYAGVGIEADENPSWAISLTKEEAKLAAEHGCVSEQGYPDWLDTLLDVHPDVVLPIIKKAFRTEWKSKQDGRSDFLYHYGNAAFPLSPHVAPTLFDIIVRSESGIVNRLDQGLRVLYRMELSERQSDRLKKLATKKLEHCIKAGEEELAQRYLALLFHVDARLAMERLKGWIEASSSETQDTLAVQIFANVFTREGRGLIADSLKDTPIKTLKELVLFAYRHVTPVGDRIREGSFSDIRDNAQSGRNTVLSALLEAKGSDAYEAVIELANTSEVGESSHRFRQLARGMVERDAECSAWTENEIVEFENKYIVPIKTGDTLYRTVLAVLDDIRYGLVHEDASSKGLLSILSEIKGDNEESVQNWLAEQLTLRADGRYHVHRETEVANKNRPDIIVSGTAAQVEIAIEVKQADSWSPTELKIALTQQLAEDYLKTQPRRHGILFMTDHGRRRWKNPLSRKRLSFDGLLAFLAETASTTTRNSTGKVEVSVFGIDATG